MLFNGRETEKLVVSAILLDEQGRVLLQQRDEKTKQYPNWWTIFGGYQEGDETLNEAIRRELDEELALDIPLVYWKAYVCPVRSNPGEVITMNHVFVGRLDRPVESLTLREGQGMKLFSPEEAVQLELAFEQHVILRDYIASTG